MSGSSGGMGSGGGGGTAWGPGPGDASRDSAAASAARARDSAASAIAAAAFRSSRVARWPAAFPPSVTAYNPATSTPARFAAARALRQDRPSAVAVIDRTRGR